MNNKTILHIAKTTGHLTIHTQLRETKFKTIAGYLIISIYTELYYKQRNKIGTVPTTWYIFFSSVFQFILP